jgi:hypothetical protein
MNRGRGAVPVARGAAARLEGHDQVDMSLEASVTGALVAATVRTVGRAVSREFAARHHSAAARGVQTPQTMHGAMVSSRRDRNNSFEQFWSGLVPNQERLHTPGPGEYFGADDALKATSEFGHTRSVRLPPRQPPPLLSSARVELDLHGTPGVGTYDVDDGIGGRQWRAQHLRPGGGVLPVTYSSGSRSDTQRILKARHRAQRAATARMQRSMESPRRRVLESGPTQAEPVTATRSVIIGREGMTSADIGDERLGSRSAWITGTLHARTVSSTSAGPASYDTSRGEAYTGRGGGGFGTAGVGTRARVGGAAAVSFSRTSRFGGAAGGLAGLNGMYVRDRTSRTEHFIKERAVSSLAEGHADCIERAQVVARPLLSSSQPAEEERLPALGTRRASSGGSEGSYREERKAVWDDEVVLGIADTYARHREDFVAKNRRVSARTETRRAWIDGVTPTRPKHSDKRVASVRARRQQLLKEQSKRHEEMKDEYMFKLLRKRQRLWLAMIALALRSRHMTVAVRSRRAERVSVRVLRALGLHKRRVFQAWATWVKHRRVMWATTVLKSRLRPMVRKYRSRTRGRKARVLIRFLESVKHTNEAVRAARVFHARILRVQSFWKATIATVKAQSQLLRIQFDRACLAVRVQGLKRMLRREKRASQVSQQLTEIARKQAMDEDHARRTVRRLEFWKQDEAKPPPPPPPPPPAGRSPRNAPAPPHRAAHRTLVVLEPSPLLGETSRYLHEAGEAVRSLGVVKRARRASTMLSADRGSAATSLFRAEGDEEQEWEAILAKILAHKLSAQEAENAKALMASHERGDAEFDDSDEEGKGPQTGSMFSVMRQAAAQAPDARTRRQSLSSRDRQMRDALEVLPTALSEAETHAGAAATALTVSSTATRTRRTSVEMAIMQVRALEEWPPVDEARLGQLLREVLWHRRVEHSRRMKLFYSQLADWQKGIDSEERRAQARIAGVRGGRTSEAERKAIREYLEARRPDRPRFSPLLPWNEAIDIAKAELIKQRRLNQSASPRFEGAQ